MKDVLLGPNPLTVVDLQFPAGIGRDTNVLPAPERQVLVKEANDCILELTLNQP